MNEGPSVSHPALSPNLATRAALELSPRAKLFALIGGAILVGAWASPLPILSLALIVMGMTFVALAVLVKLLGLRHERAEAGLYDTIAEFVANDAAPSFTADPDGQIGYANEAAVERFGDTGGRTLVAVLGEVFASPASVLYRMQNKALATGSAREDVVLNRGHMRLSVHRVGQGGFLWRLEDMGERSPAGRSGETIGLPMMTVSKTGTILFMNEALRRMLGGRETTLDRVFADLPLRPGAVHHVTGAHGTVSVLLVEVPLSAGRREIYLLADPAELSVRPGEWGVVESLPVPLVKLDRDGRILSANKRARALLDDDQPTGSHLSDQVEGLGRPVTDWLQDAWAGRNLGRTETMRASRVEDRFLQISLEQLHDEDGPALVAVLHDATELKSLETQFVQSQKMQAIGQLAGGVAHDFNNLLTAISGHCDLLLLRHDQGDPDFSDLNQISQNANRAAALVGQLLAFSRKQTLRPEVLELSDTVGDLTHLLGRLVGERINLEFTSGRDILPVRADKRQLEQVLMNLVVNARDAMLPEGGRIRLQLENTYLSKPLERDRAIVPTGDYVTIRVIDEGTGIKPEVLGRIFEPFVTTKGPGKGTGLGLSMVYGIVKQSGAYIFVDSVVGTGATFTLYFPVHREPVGLVKPTITGVSATPPARQAADGVGAMAGEIPGATNAATAPAAAVPAEAQVGSADATVPASARADSALAPVAAQSDQAQQPAAQSAAGHPEGAGPAVEGADAPGQSDLPRPTHAAPEQVGGIVLLVEDEAPVRAFASRALRLKGYTVLEAENAEEALKTLEDESLDVDVFVTDVVMPGMDGPTWVSEALRDRPGVKVVFVSGYAEDSVSEHQARIPNSVFLPKPFSLSELTATVSRQLH